MDYFPFDKLLKLRFFCKKIVLNCIYSPNNSIFAKLSELDCISRCHYLPLTLLLPPSLPALALFQCQVICRCCCRCRCCSFPRKLLHLGESACLKCQTLSSAERVRGWWRRGRRGRDSRSSDTDGSSSPVAAVSGGKEMR